METSNRNAQLRRETPLDDALFRCFAIDAAYVNRIGREDFQLGSGEGFAIFCLEGSLMLTAENEPVGMTSCALCTFFSGTHIGVAGCTDDFKGYVVVVSSYFLTNLDTHVMITYYLHSQVSPVIQLPRSEIRIVRSILRGLEVGLKRPKHPYSQEILREVLMIALYRLCAIYESQHPILPPGQLRGEELLKEFLRLVEANYLTRRDLGFYAQRLCLTPKYLSSLVKRISGRSGAEWIDYVVIMSAKSTLRSSQMSVQQVADYLNFPNASFFGKYFKKHTGMTPREYKLRQ